jgi:transcriptional regulator with XRE-family HTH domain
VSDELANVLGRRIQQRRRELDLNQKQLAEMIGASNQFVSQVENGVSLPSLGSLVKFAQALGTTTDHLLLGSINAQRDLAAAIRSADGLSAAAKHALLVLVDELRDRS